jgi:hypothetical protein
MDFKLVLKIPKLSSLPFNLRTSGCCTIAESPQSGHNEVKSERCGIPISLFNIFLQCPLGALFVYGHRLSLD